MNKKHILILIGLVVLAFGGYFFPRSEAIVGVVQGWVNGKFVVDSKNINPNIYWQMNIDSATTTDIGLAFGGYNDRAGTITVTSVSGYVASSTAGAATGIYYNIAIGTTCGTTVSKMFTNDIVASKGGRASDVPNSDATIAPGECWWFAPTSTVGLASTTQIQNLRLNLSGYETP